MAVPAKERTELLRIHGEGVRAGTEPTYFYREKEIVDWDFINDFLNLYPELEGKNIKKILYNFNEYIANVVMNTREGISLPYFMGDIITVVYPAKGNTYNINKSVETGTVVTYTNMQSDGYNCRIMYSISKVTYRFKYARYWGFEPSDKFRKAQSISYPPQWKKFVVIPNTRFANEIYRKPKNLMYADKMRKEELKTYDPLKWED
jgi:hypothetical protein